MHHMHIFNCRGAVWGGRGGGCSGANAPSLQPKEYLGYNRLVHFHSNIIRRKVSMVSAIGVVLYHFSSFIGYGLPNEASLKVKLFLACHSILTELVIRLDHHKHINMLLNYLHCCGRLRINKANLQEYHFVFV